MKSIIIKIAACACLAAFPAQPASAQEVLPESERIFEICQNVSRKDLLASGNMDNLTMYIRMPLYWSPERDKEYRKQRVKSVRGVIAFSNVNSDAEDSRRHLLTNTSNYCEVLEFADKYNMAVIAWPNFRGYNKNKNNEDFTKEEKKKYKSAFELRAKYWEMAYKDAIKTYNLPENNMIVYGISGGAQIAHRLVMRFPQYFAGIYMHVSASYDSPSPGASKVLWFISTGEADGGYANSERFYKKLLDMGYMAIFKAFENLGHARNDAVIDMYMSFYEYLLAFMPDANDPEWKAPPVDKFYMMKYPTFIGDYLNHVAYPYETATKYIDRKYMVALPTRSIAKAWGMIIEQ